jgi:hypothetical protein
MIPLNEFGRAVWRHKTDKTLFVERSYDWSDRIIVPQESTSRQVIGDTKFSTFDFTNWIPVKAEEMSRVKSFFKEIYDTDQTERWGEPQG